MNVALWVLQGLAAVLFLMAGSQKAFRPVDVLAKQWEWVGTVPPHFVRFLGVSELLGAVGLIVPTATAIFPQLSIAAALGLAVVMVSATALHVSRREYRQCAVTLAILATVLVVAYGRWTLMRV